MSDTVTHWSIDRLDTLRLIQPPQRIEPKSGQPRVQGRAGVGSAFSEVLARELTLRRKLTQHQHALEHVVDPTWAQYVVGAESTEGYPNDQCSNA